MNIFLKKVPIFNVFFKYISNDVLFSTIVKLLIYKLGNILILSYTQCQTMLQMINVIPCYILAGLQKDFDLMTSGHYGGLLTLERNETKECKSGLIINFHYIIYQINWCERSACARTVSVRG